MSTLSSQIEIPMVGTSEVSEELDSASSHSSEGIDAESSTQEPSIPMAATEEVVSEEVLEEKSEEVPKSNGVSHENGTSAKKPNKKNKVPKKKEKPLKEIAKEWWELCQLAMDAPQSRKARFLLGKRLHLLNAYPSLKEKILETLKRMQYTKKEDLRSDEVLVTQTRLLAFVVAGRWKAPSGHDWGLDPHDALSQEDEEYQRIKALCDQRVTALPQDPEQRQMILEMLEPPESLDHELIREKAKLWIEKIKPKTNVYYEDPKENDAENSDNDGFQTYPQRLPVVKASAWIALRYIEDLVETASKVMGFPALPKEVIVTPLKGSFTEPEKIWNHVCRCLAYYIMAIKAQLKEV